MIEPEIAVTQKKKKKNKNGEFKGSFHALNLERNKVMYLLKIQTVVHEIDAKSPLFKYSKDEIKNLEAHLYLLLNYHEEFFHKKYIKFIISILKMHCWI